MTDQQVARMIIESDAYRMSALPESIFRDADAGRCNPRLTIGMHAAYDAFHLHVTENDIEELRQQFEKDIRDGLKELK